MTGRNRGGNRTPKQARKPDEQGQPAASSGNNPNLPRSIAIFVAIVGAIAALLTAFNPYFQQLYRTPTPVATTGAVAVSTATLATSPSVATAAPVPSSSPPPTTAPLSVVPTEALKPPTPPSAGIWTPYDTFTDTDISRSKWLIDDPGTLCTLTPGNGRLQFDCTKRAVADYHVPTLEVNQDARSFTGVRVLVSLERSDGIFQLTSDWQCQDPNTKRHYELQIDGDEVEALEYYPEKNWEQVPLGTLSIAKKQQHRLQIERDQDTIVFLVDGKAMPLDKVPDFQPCSTMTLWTFDLNIAGDNDVLKGEVEEVSIRQGS